MAENSLISGIRKAIENCEIAESNMIKERDKVLPILRGARHLNASTFHLVERQYNEKIENAHQEIEDIQAHLKELMADG